MSWAACGARPPALPTKGCNGSSGGGFSPDLLATIIATEIAGGGPEDPLADAAVAEEIVAADGAEAVSPIINPANIAGKTPAEIDAAANEAGLIPKGPDPMNGQGAYVDPVTGEQRILSHPDADIPHAHVNDATGQRLDINGNPVPAESPAAHLPIGQ